MWGGWGRSPDYRTRAIVGKGLIWWGFVIFGKGILTVWRGVGAARLLVVGIARGSGAQ